MESVFRVNMISTPEVLLDWTKTVMVSFADFLLLQVHSRIRIIWICSYFLLLRAGVIGSILRRLLAGFMFYL